MEFLRVLCLVQQWHNPFMWWAYAASKKDCEMACDARVVRNMSQEERYRYGASLLTILEWLSKRICVPDCTLPWEAVRTWTGDSGL